MRCYPSILRVRYVSPLTLTFRVRCCHEPLLPAATTPKFTPTNTGRRDRLTLLPIAAGLESR
jgi:hypothetical protein